MQLTSTRNPMAAGRVPVAAIQHTPPLPERSSRMMSLVSWNGASDGSRILLQRPAAQLEPFAPGAGKAYVARRAFDPDIPLLNGTKFVGGFEFWNFRVPPAGVLVALLRRNGGAAWRMRGSAGAGNRFYGLWLLPKSTFSVTEEGAISLRRVASLSLRITTNPSHHFAARFVVQCGERFFLSRSATDRVGRFMLFGETLGDQKWAAYDPCSDLRANSELAAGTAFSSVAGGAALLHFDTPSSALTDLQAIGVYAEAIDRSPATDRCLEWDELCAELNP